MVIKYKKIAKYSLLMFLLIACSNYKEEYYEDGTLKSKIELDKANNYHGEGLFYNESGDLKKVIGYNEGVIETCHVYYMQDKLRWACTYKNGKKHGIYKSYYRNGGEKMIISYDLGENVSSQMYDSTGILIYEFKKITIDSLPPFSKDFILINPDSLTINSFISVKFVVPGVLPAQIIPAIANGEAVVQDRINGIWLVKPIKDVDTLRLGIRIELSDTSEYFYGWYPYPIPR